MATVTSDDLVDRWIAAWTQTRGLTSSVVDGWPLVRVGSRTRETELICVDPGPAAFAHLLRHVAGDPRAMLTVIADDAAPYDEVPLPAGVRVDRDDEILMVTDFVPVPASPIDGRFSPRWDTIEHLATYALECDGRIAAEGTIGIHGADATFDAVETLPEFQRLGLGRHVMTALTAYALERGAHHGVLAATSQGRRLYQALGWAPAREMRSLMGVD